MKVRDVALAFPPPVGNTHRVKAMTLDARRRLTMPSEIAPRAAVTIEHTGKDTWVIRRVRRSKMPLAILVEPLSDEEARRAFASDTKAEAFEATMSRAQSFPRFEE